MFTAITLSVFFGLVAAIALLSCHACIRYGFIRWGETKRELAVMGRVCETGPRPLRRPREAFALLAA